MFTDIFSIDVTLLGRTLDGLAHFRSSIVGHSSKSDARLETILLGGIVGSFFSLLQFLVAPWIGKASDHYGRRPILLLSVVGNLLSNLVWVIAATFPTFIISRTLGGLSEGNVQLAGAIIADITSPASRSRSMALVGIAFSIAFTIGPALSGYFVSKQVFATNLITVTTHPFAAAALLACILIIVEIIVLFFFLDETITYRSNIPPSTTELPPSTYSDPVKENLINRIHFAYLFVFSGMEFTLPFLAFDKFNFTYTQQGKLFGFLGILSVLVQGGYVRRSNEAGKLVAQGMGACLLGLLALGLVARIGGGETALYVGVTFLAFASATVVSCLTALLTLTVDQGQGAALGRFRSYGQLGRAFGPVVACGAYWGLGPSTCYFLGAASVGLVLLQFRKLGLANITKPLSKNE